MGFLLALIKFNQKDCGQFQGRWLVGWALECFTARCHCRNLSILFLFFFCFTAPNSVPAKSGSFSHAVPKTYLSVYFSRDRFLLFFFFSFRFNQPPSRWNLRCPFSSDGDGQLTRPPRPLRIDQFGCIVCLPPPLLHQCLPWLLINNSKNRRDMLAIAFPTQSTQLSRLSPRIWLNSLGIFIWSLWYSNLARYHI